MRKPQAQLLQAELIGLIITNQITFKLLVRLGNHYRFTIHEEYRLGKLTWTPSNFLIRRKHELNQPKKSRLLLPILEEMNLPYFTDFIVVTILNL